MNKNPGWKLLMIMVLTSLAGSPAGSDLYSYVDKHGTRVFTNIGYRNATPSQSETRVSGFGINTNRISPDAIYYEDIIQHYASRHQVSEDLVKAMIQVESNYDPYAVSIKNCKGLMQLHPDTASRFGVKDVFNPEENIAGGIKYLSFLMDHFDQNLNFALAAYNSGENSVKRFNGIPPYPETINYVKKVRSLAGMEEEQAPPRSRPVIINRVLDSSGNITLTNY